MGKIILPKTQISFLLHLLIKKKDGVTENDFNVNGYRSRLSNLEIKYNLPLKEKWCKGVNRFGNSMMYKKHILLRKDVPFAKKLYKTLINR